MAYTKHNWLQRLGTGLNKFKDTITNQVLALVNQPDSVTQAGTPLRADWLNEMEEGIRTAHVTADNALPKTAQAADSAKLGGQAPSAFATAAQGTKADNAMPITGGTFTAGVSIPGMYIPAGYQGTMTDAPLYSYSLVNKGYVDKLNTNAGASNISPNTMTSLVGLTQHADCPNATEYWYIITFMHYINKVQIALPYARSGSDATMDMHVRIFYESYGWSKWSWFSANPKTLFGSSVPSALAPGQIFVKI